MCMGRWHAILGCSRSINKLKKVTLSLVPTRRNHMLITVTSHELVAKNHYVRKNNLLPCRIAEPFHV